MKKAEEDLTQAEKKGFDQSFGVILPNDIKSLLDLPENP